MQTTRKYELKERARRQEETRRRITEAAVALHEELGPAATPIAEIARRAGVQRLTVYKHFPDDEALIGACSAHWSAAHPPPDPRPWTAIEDPLKRVEVALRELYAYYAKNRRMLGHVVRDARAMPAVRDALERDFGPYLTSLANLLAAPWRARGRRGKLLDAQLALVLPFEGWELLARSTGDDADRAAELAAALVTAAAR